MVSSSCIAHVAAAKETLDEKGFSPFAMIQCQSYQCICCVNGGWYYIAQEELKVVPHCVDRIFIIDDKGPEDVGDISIWPSTFTCFHLTNVLDKVMGGIVEESSSILLVVGELRLWQEEMVGGELSWHHRGQQQPVTCPGFRSIHERGMCKERQGHQHEMTQCTV
eukprot:7564306-Ditylum_brightwellii.AAC.1